MVADFKGFRASLFTTSLRRASPAFAIFMVGLSLVLGMSGLARAAEPLQLTCETDESVKGRDNYRTSPVKFRIDLDNRIIELLEPSGSVMAATTDKKMNALAPSVRITNATVEWRLANSIGSIFDGSINRETGDARATWFGPQGTYNNAPNVMWFFAGRCSRATQKF